MRARELVDVQWHTVPQARYAHVMHPSWWRGESLKTTHEISCKSRHQTSQAPHRRDSGLSGVRQFERKKEMRA